MIRHHVQKSAKDAVRYYSAPDYYAAGAPGASRLLGGAARLLGVEHSNVFEHFERLCHNQNPLTGEPLTARSRGDRIVGVDFTFDGPKGFSVLEALTGDARLRQALRDAAAETLAEMEQAMAARVRKGGRDENRTTGNMLYYLAEHDTTRPVDGVPDMQPHLHAFVLNATWDAAERQWKAANLLDVMRDMPYYQAAFHARLAGKLNALGYETERKGNFFEVAGVPKSVIDKFSRRTAEIEKAAKEQGVTDPARKAELGAQTREHKGDELGWQQLRRLWVSRLTESERQNLAGLRLRAAEREREGWQPHGVTAREAVQHAADHTFERRSSAPAREVLAKALTFGVGSVSPEAAWAELERGDRFTAPVSGRLHVSSRAALEEERRMVKRARDGLATLAPLNPGWEIQDHALNIQQRAAVHRLLGSRDAVTMLVGDAGVGKTRLLKDAKEGAEAAGVRVLAFAPSASASRGNLREEGFEGAETVARLLADKQLQARARGQVILVDEAALLGTKETAALLQLAADLRARVWLVGDHKQHRAVSRGAPFKLLQSEAGLIPARVSKIQRQKGGYKRTVELARDDPAQALARLRTEGGVVEVPGAERYQKLAEDYLHAVQPEGGKEKTALVIAPTHAEGAKVTAAIRDGLRAQGRLGKDREFLQLKPLHLTEADRKDAQSYEAGDVLQFTQNAKGFTRGERVALAEGEAPPAHLAARFQAFRPGTIGVAVGDRLRVTLNGTTKDGHRLDNGSLFSVAGFTKAGDIIDHRGWVVGRDFGHLAHGYVTTSVSSQSKTVDRVLVAMGAESLSATNREQFYVSLSRGREWAKVYTDDVQALTRGVQKQEREVSATELAARRKALLRHRRKLERHVLHLRRREEPARLPPAWQLDADRAGVPQLGVDHER